jgi:proline iminopeptidase
MLEVGDGNQVYWEACGNPDGKPAVIVHGGPGSGCRPGQGRIFDPERYRLVLFDQRGCGRSRPHASDPATDMRHNTTAHLMADMELLREHLGIGRWLLFGYSWGSTLSLAYAERYPERVSEIVISSVTTTRRAEIDWLYRGAGRFSPSSGSGSWRARPARHPTGTSWPPTPAWLRIRTRRCGRRPRPGWCAWEDALLSVETNGAAVFGDGPPEARLVLVRICAHYFSHGAWLEDGVLLREAHRLAGIPGVLTHGRLDMSGPPDTAWQLARAWPGAELTVIEDAGHLGNEAETSLVVDTLNRFAGGSR